MRDARLFAVAAAGLALAACAKSVCEKTADAFDTYRENAIPCGAKGGVGSLVPSFKIGDACAVVEGACTGADETIMQTYADCVSAVPKCEVGKEGLFLDAEPTCLQSVFPTGLSPECGDALTDGVCKKLGEAMNHFDSVVTGCSADLPKVKAAYSDCVAASTTQCTWDDRWWSMEQYAACLNALPSCGTSADDQATFDAKIMECHYQLYVFDPCLSGIFEIPPKYLPAQLCATLDAALAKVSKNAELCPTADLSSVALITDDLGCTDETLGNCCSDLIAGNCLWVDRTGLNAFATCVSAVPACEAGKEADFTDALQACVDARDSVVTCGYALVPE
jgi:hypothetical protein